MSETRFLPVLLLLAALTVPATLFGQVTYDVSDQKIVSGDQTYYLHQVLKDQTLYSIAKTYKVSIDAITRNNVITPNGIQTDQVLMIPESAAMAAHKPKSKPKPSAAESEAKEAPPVQAKETEAAEISQPAEKEVKSVKPKENALPVGYRMHKVKKGETLYSLSRDYKVTVEAIIRTNDVPRNEIQIGQMLKIPPSDYETFVKEETSAAEALTEETKSLEAPVKKASEPQPQAQAQTAKPAPEKQPAEPKKYHKVKKGESLSDIATKYNVTVREIKDANDGLIFPMPGMKLVIPVKSGETEGAVIKE